MGRGAAGSTCLRSAAALVAGLLTAAGQPSPPLAAPYQGSAFAREPGSPAPSFHRLGYQSESDSRSRYELHVRLDPQEQVLSGLQRVSYPNRSTRPMKEIHFVLAANQGAHENPHLSGIANAQGFMRGFEPSWTRIHRVEDPQGRPMVFELIPGLPNFQTYSLDEGFLVVRLAKALQPGEEAHFTIHFSTGVPTRQGDRATLNREYIWRFGWHPQERYWDPAREGWSEGEVLSSFRFSLELSVPRSFQIAVGADWYEEQEMDGLRVGRCGSEVPVRSIPLLVTDNMIRRTRKVGDIEVSALANPDWGIFDRSREEAEEFLDLVERILAYYTEHYGEYRYRRLVIAELPMSEVSMAADGMLLLSDIFWIYNHTWLAWGIFTPYAEVTLAHELAHLWWGIGIGTDFDRHNWLSEAFAQYLSISYMTATHGRDGVSALRPNWFVRWALGSIDDIKLPSRQVEEVIIPSYRDHVRFGLDGVISDPARKQEHLESLTMLYYEKGYLVLRALELFMPIETVELVLREMQKRYAGSVATIDDFQRVAQEVSGRDLGRLFGPWIHGRATADYVVDDVISTRISDGYEHEVRVRCEGDGPLPIRLRVVEESGHESWQDWDPVSGERSLQLTTASPIERVELDPLGLAPDLDRANNFHPRKMAFSMLMARNDPEAYVFCFKPTRFSRLGSLGPAIGGNYLDDHQWWIGAGIGGATSVWSKDAGSQGPGLDDSESKDSESKDSEQTSMRVGAYAESAWRLSRSQALLAGLGASYLAIFDGSSIGLRLGWAAPVLPSSWDPAAGRITLHLVMLPNAL